MHRQALWILLAGMLVLVTLGRAGATRVAAQSPVDHNPFVDLLPLLRTAPAPPWVQRGVRITYYSAAASIPGQSYILVPDDKGNWIVQGTGQRYGEQQLFGSGGHGYTQVNVIWLDRAVAVLEVRSFGLPVPGGLPFLQSLGGAVGLPGAGGEYWMHPQGLQRALGVGGGGLRVLRMLYPLGGRQYRVVRFQSVSASGSQAWTFDEETGVLLHSGSSSVGGTVPGPVKQGDAPGRGTVIVLNRLVEVRAVTLPWSSGAAPGWVSAVRFLRYGGTQTIAVPGAGSAPIPVAATFERRYAGAQWARYVSTVIQSNVPGLPPNTMQVDRVFGPAQAGGLWISPNELGRLQPGQVLDRDAVTRMTLMVGQAARPDHVVITEGHDGQRFEWGYDRASGLLLYVNILEIDPVTATRTLTQLQLLQRQ